MFGLKGHRDVEHFKEARIRAGRSLGSAWLPTRRIGVHPLVVRHDLRVALTLASCAV